MRAKTRLKRWRPRVHGPERLEDRRLLAIVDLDSTFGNGGIAAYESLGNTRSNDWGLDVAVDSNGKYLVAGLGGGIVRVTPTGSVDGSFGVFGRATALGEVRSIHILPDDGFFTAGNNLNGGTYDYFVAKYLASRQLDPSFGDGGKLYIDIEGRDDVAYKVMLDSEGRVVVIGTTTDPSNFSRSFVSRFLPDGRPDREFGNNGRVTIIYSDANGALNTRFFAGAIDNSDRVIAGGGFYNGSGWRFGIVRLSPTTGALDSNFDSDGRVDIALGTFDDAVTDIKVDSLGRIVAAGYSFQSSSNSYDTAVVRLHSNGALDASFSGDGKVVTSLSGFDDRAQSVNILEDGGFVTSGYVYTAGLSNFALVRYKIDGTLNNLFDGDGVLTTPIGPIDNAMGFRAAIDPLGRIVHVGTANMGEVAVGVVTFDVAMNVVLPTGALDPTFSGDGKLTLNGLQSYESAVSVASQPDGSIIVVGNSASGTSQDVIITRLKANGDRDLSFGTTGLGYTRFGSSEFNDFGFSVATLPDGRIYFGAAIFDGSRFRPAVARLTATGAFDTSFAGGYVVPSFGTGDEWFNSLMALPDGKVLAAGTSKVTGNIHSVALARFNENGSLDTTFDGDGKKTFTFHGVAFEEARAVTVDSSGSIYVAGRAWNGSNDDAIVAKLNADGSFDNTFDADGKFVYTYGGSHDVISALALQSDGRVVAAGYTFDVSSNAYRFALARVRPEGALDPSFSIDGKLMTEFGTIDDAATGVVIQPDGKIIAAGYTRGENQFDIALSRYTPDGQLDLSFDGDGQRIDAIGNSEDRAFGVALQTDGRLLVAGVSDSGQTTDIAVLRYDETEILRLVKDINQSEFDAFPGGLTEINGTYYFTATTPDHGSELWITDGTVNGTKLVKDIAVGMAGSKPSDLVVVNGKLLFSAGDGIQSRTLWISDGTAEGTHPVKTSSVLELDDQFIFPPGTTVVGGVAYFQGADHVGNGYELWRSDGTDAGTYMIKNIRPANFGAHVEQIVDFGGIAYFSAWDGSNGPELWRSDGTAAGTFMVADGEPGANGIDPQFLTVFEGQLYFNGRTTTSGAELWRSNGTAAGTSMVADIEAGANGSIPTDLTVMGNALYFSASNSSQGRELWKYTTASGVSLIKDVATGSASSHPSELVNVAGTLYFSATDGTSGTELWKSDGTSDGTIRVADIRPGVSSSLPQEMVAFGNMVYFAASDPVSGRELWRSDGSAAGTVLVKDFIPGVVSGDPGGFLVSGGMLYLRSKDGLPGNDLWRSDGTAVGTVPITSIVGTASFTSFIPMFPVGDSVYFAAFDPLKGYDLYKSDGTADGTVLVKDFNPFPSFERPQDFIEFNGMLYFSAVDGANGRQLWKSDGTTTGTTGWAIGSGDASMELAVLNGKLIFTAIDTNSGRELWITDGTTAGTRQLKDINPGASHGDPTNFVVDGDTMYFTANHPLTGYELWKTDGTTAGTQLVADLTPSNFSFFIQNLTAANGKTFFSLFSSTTGQELWMTDGTEVGTVLVKDINPGSASSSPSNMLNVNGTVYFSANNGSSGYELWRTDGTASGTMMVDDIEFGANESSNPRQLTYAAGKVFFTATTIYGDELWAYDIAANMTYLVKDIYQYDEGSFPSGLVSAGDRIYFEANDGINGEELWESDGTPWGTRLVDNLTGDSGGSDPNRMVVTQDRLYVFAQTRQTGTELYSMELGDPADIVMGSAVMAKGGNTITVQYDILERKTDAFTLLFAQSADDWWSSDDASLISITLSDPADRTVGTHQKVFTIGTGPGQIPLPANFGTAGNTSRVLAVADPNKAIRESDAHHFSEDNTKVLEVRALSVTSSSPTPTGIVVNFNTSISESVLNLYDSSAGLLGPADATLVGNSVGNVRGSLVLSADRKQLTFIASGGLLPPDTYTLRLRSASDGFVETLGSTLDGDGNGVPGGDYVRSFAVTSVGANEVVVSLPDFTRGKGQTVNVPLTTDSGFPVMLSTGKDVTGVDLEITFDPGLLDVTGFTTAIPGASSAFNVLSPGRVRITVSSATEFSSAVGAIELGRFAAVVPNNAAYGARHLLRISSLSLIDLDLAVRPSRADDGIHVASYLGDNSGNQSYSSGDSTLAQRLLVGIGTGFTAYPLVDPWLITDVNRSNSLTSGDVTLIQRKVVGIVVPQIPDLPSGPLGPIRNASGLLDPVSTEGGAAMPHSVPLDALAAVYASADVLNWGSEDEDERRLREIDALYDLW